MELNINLSDKRSIEKAIAKLKSIKLGTDFDNKIVNNLVNICYDKCVELCKGLQNFRFSVMEIP